MQELSWQAPEFERAERSANWYMWSIVVAVLLIVVALWQKNILFALFVGIAEVILVFLSHGPATTRVYSLNEGGLFMENILLRPLNEVGAFALVDLGGRYIELILRPSRKFHTYTKVLVLREREPEVVAFLSNYAPQFEYQPTMADVIGRRLGL